MSVDFAMFNLTELSVLDATDTVAMPEMGASSASLVEDMDDLIGESSELSISICCSSSSSTCCC
ncbi:hypothetical protein GXW83_22760 [Streptacidiphilus sp. PB12-B1b]|uniref:thiopeptide-type bacteriocin n=1 Tax=Streptacidiphilus sp. PB12-B1b TaxID=2705012 RepID=UPI0015F7AB4A|nr:thiopeptide-type bacteriocin [Streptacidiphilus sp. PB12-B1b]QMU74408.1 hypothetical protein GXW83_22760 [Streptacidiphilus sp. PB12-B1b]